MERVVGGVIGVQRELEAIVYAILELGAVFLQPEVARGFREASRGPLLDLEFAFLGSRSVV
jgi:hypothetical protein